MTSHHARLGTGSWPLSADGLLAESGSPVRVLALSGTRSEWDLIEPLLASLRADSDFSVGVIASGAHPTPIHDFSIRQIQADGYEITATVFNLTASSAPAARAKTTANLLADLAGVLDRENPDLLLVLGDREEAIAAALAGSYVRVPVVHLAGGDHTHPIGGDIDEEIRHATSKLAHIHLTMAEEHSERLRRLGEEPWRVHTVGSCGLDKIRSTAIIDPSALADVLGDGVRGEYAVVIHHAVHSKPLDGASEVETILRTVTAAGVHVFLGQPNTDTGSHEILETIRDWASSPLVRVYDNLPRREFVSLLAHAGVLIGNSSLGLHEASMLDLPVINVGQRQRGRLHGPNVQWVEASPGDIESALERALRDETYREEIKGLGSPYGDGRSADRARLVLRSLPGRDALLSKRQTY